jgi:tetratricopeptide (TPR) repeat protein
MSKPTGLAVVFLVVAAALPVSAASGQPAGSVVAPENDATAPPQAAKERFNKGVELAGLKKYEEAISIWLEVLGQLGAEDVPTAHKAMGLAYKKLGRLPEA